jgi:hypothetical protein
MFVVLDVYEIDINEITRLFNTLYACMYQIIELHDIF